MNQWIRVYSSCIDCFCYAFCVGCQRSTLYHKPRDCKSITIMMMLSIIWLQLLTNVYAGVYLLKFDMPDFLLDDSSSRSRTDDMLEVPVKHQQISPLDYVNKWPVLRNLLTSADKNSAISSNDDTNDVRDLYNKFVESLRTLTATPLRTLRSPRSFRQSKAGLADLMMNKALISAVKRKPKKSDTRK
uniref:Uncharacterized protein n=1 Tax=Glossina pallidipes TaxID=7398 RepID=A0A1B0AIF3_GLOPL